MEDSGEFIGTFRENVIRVIGSYSTKGDLSQYDKQIEKLQRQMFELIENNAKRGAISEDFDMEYKELSEQINELNVMKIKMVQDYKQAESYGERLKEIDKTMTTLKHQVKEFDQDLIKRLITSIKVDKGMEVEIQFHSGIVVKKQIGIN